ncbi:restriction endonuclease subunit S [Vibrio fluvialis]|nr:restriction endonuclease subunit S [Vibrio fluvialis]
MFENSIPKVWCVTSIDEVAEVKGGKRLPKGKKFTSEPTPFPYIRVTDFCNGSIDTSELKYIDEGTREAIRNYTISSEDLYISIAGTIGLVGCVPQSLSGANLTENAAKLCLLNGVDKFYLRYVLNSQNASEQFQDKMTSSGQPKLALFRIKSCTFPLPALAEQKIITEKLDTLLAQVEATKARLESTLETLKQFRQSVLAAAVSGKLTEDWIDEREAWGKYALSELCRSVSDGDHQAPPRSDEGIPFLVISNVSDGVINFNSVTRWVPLDYYESLKSIRKPEKRDILYTVTGSFGIPVIVDTSKPFCFQRHIAIIKPNHDKVNYKYLTLYLSSIEALRKAESVATGTAQKTVSLTNLRKFVIPLPSPEEQEEIVKRVEKLLAGTDVTEQQVNQALERVNNLTQSILAKAFRGELSEQWRKDNPELISGENSAEALLKKIKAERVAAKPKRKARTTSA